MTVVTRFAPSPTGFLHIGGARTALFNWLFARHHGGVFHLRIEDTDRARSTQPAIDAIIDGLRWLELDWDGEIVYQSRRFERHQAVAEEMLARGKAYRCYCTPEELQAMRDQARADGRAVPYDRRWRDRDERDAPAGVKPVIRFKAPIGGETIIDDLVQGTVRVANDQLDDLVLLRADGTPTYMLSVIVDDHDMAISHVIRGDDHLTNAFRQKVIYQALDWAIPQFAHIPLIHGPDGAKLSKRHGALGVDAYRDMGILPEAMRNYLLRLGWSHGDDEIISTAQAIGWFGLSEVGRSPSRFDMAKVQAVNAHYLREADDARLLALALPHLNRLLGYSPDATAQERLRRGLAGLKPRAKTLIDLAEGAAFYARSVPLPMAEKAARLLTPEARGRLGRLRDRFAAIVTWTETDLDSVVRAFAEEENLKLGDLAQPLRAALTGSVASPGIFEVMTILGRGECLARIDAIVV